MSVPGRGSAEAGFAGDAKDPGAMRTIGEVSAALGIKPHVLRYWEDQFDTLRPLKRSGGRRLYRSEDIALIERIDRLVNREGYTIRGARQALRAAPDIPATGETPADLPEGQVASSLRQIRTRLAAALAS